MFTAPLSPIEEYWVGYFRADGSISRPGTRQAMAIFAQARFHPVREFANFIGQRSVGSRLVRTNLGVGMMHKVTSTGAGLALDKLGVKNDLLPEIYESRHFWRGLLDGDGCLGVYRRPSGRKWALVNLTGSLNDVTRLGEYFRSVTGRNYTKIVAVSGAFRISFSGNAAKFLVNLLYSGEYSANIQKSMKAHAIIQLPTATNTCAWSPL